MNQGGLIRCMSSINKACNTYPHVVYSHYKTGSQLVCIAIVATYDLFTMPRDVK